MPMEVDDGPNEGNFGRSYRAKRSKDSVRKTLRKLKIQSDSLESLLIRSNSSGGSKRLRFRSNSSQGRKRLRDKQ